MKGDFSRLRFNQNKHYTSVLEQQGRVALDADANEQCAINEHIRDTENVDIIGPFGGPKTSAGFGITVSGNTIQIGAGNYYVNGLLCENGAPLGFMNQPFLIHPPLSDSQLLSELQSGTVSAIPIFLEVWQRLVTSLDDPCLAEPALGQADTTARLQTVWRVVAQPIAATTSTPTLGTLSGGLHLATGLTDVIATRLGATLAPPIIGTVPVGTIPVAAPPVLTANPPVLTTNPPVLSTNPPVLTTNPPVQTTNPPVLTTNPPAVQDCCVSMYTQPLQLAPGKLSAQPGSASADCSCQPTPAAGYRGLENQLYRVEIHQGGTEKTATFKWSRENGSVVVAVTGIAGSQVTVESLGPDANLGFATGGWVELSDDTYLFGTPPNRPGELFQIQTITPGQLSVTMSGTVSQIDSTRNARMRRWEQSGPTAGPTGIPLPTSAWFELENGIQIQFSAGNYQPGDYWLIPARTATGQIEWPPCGSDGATAQPPHRIDVRRAPLACIHWDPKAQQFNVEECRRFFPALTAIAGGAKPALHVSQISWRNDDVMTLDQLLANGLVVSLDQAATSHVDSAAFSVTLEVPVASPLEAAAVLEGLVPIVLRTAMPLDGQVALQTTGISWSIPYLLKGQIQQVQFLAIATMNAMLLQGAAYASFTRVRVRLLGAKIFAGTGSTQLFLDGEAFGITGTRSDGVTPRTDLVFPTGAQQAASDFESWFYLAPVLAITGLSVQPPTVVLSLTAPAPPAVTATVTLNYAPMADTVVTLSVTTPPNISPVVTVPPNVTVSKNTVTKSFPVTVGNTSNATAQVFQIVASLPNALGTTSTFTANFTLTGFQVIQ
ncbi:MAG TPA: DUF6519 domain-containing protein [Bryobacteraceae bacterium]|nr:DUF6519 domain-containing protein [Bryobacteraceae bacterium]